MANLGNCASAAINLAVDIVFTTKEIIDLLLGKAFREAKAVGMEGNILAPELTQDIITKAYRNAQFVAEEGKIITQ